MVEIVNCVMFVVKFGGYDVILFDIVGCIYIDELLMVEMVDVKVVVNLYEIILVVDGLIG